MLDISKIYTSKNCGTFRVVNYANYYNVEIEFTLTGYRSVVSSGAVCLGKVKDRMTPSIYGVGFIGDGKYSTKIKGRENKAYTTWRNMIARCYCSDRQDIQPTYKGCTVDKEWHNFQVFSEWYELNYIAGQQLDKDIKVKGNKVYSAETCLFVSSRKNIECSHAKHYEFIDPQGRKVKIYNMKKFCRSNDLKSGTMSLVHSGKARQHKGWTKG